MKSFFISGTGTEVGKTVVCGLMADWLLRRSHSVITQKWVQTGCEHYSDDIKQHCKLAGISFSELPYMRHVAPYVFKLPASPHLAAAFQGSSIRTSRIVSSFSFLQKQYESVLVEGAGGLLVPLNKRTLIIDLAAQLKLPLLLVVANQLGAINQTLLSIEAARARQVAILGIVFNNIVPKSNKVVLEDNIAIIKEIAKVRVFGTLKKSASLNTLRKSFAPIAQKIYPMLLKP